jgi:hypothetical protein
MRRVEVYGYEDTLVHVEADPVLIVVAQSGETRYTLAEALALIGALTAAVREAM